MSKLIAITGSCASGKTTLLKKLAAKYNVLSIDNKITNILETYPIDPVISSLINDILGVRVINDKGELDYYVMIRIIWNETKFKQYYRLLYNITRQYYLAINDMVIVESPLLFEVGYPHDFDKIIYVDAPFDVRLNRIINDNRNLLDHVNPKEWLYNYEQLLKSDYAKAHSHHIINSDISLEDFEKLII